MQFGAAVLATLVLFLLWKVADADEYSVAPAVLICAFYGLLPVRILRHGAYWFAAFFHYVMPVSAIILFLVVYFRHRENGFSVKTLIMMAVAVLFASYSQEQLGAAVTFMLCLILLYEVFEKKVKWHHFLFIGIALVSTAVLMLGPATQSRASAHSYTMVQLIVTASYSTIWGFFSSDMRIFIILLHTTLAVFSAELRKNDHGILRFGDLCCEFLAIVSILIYCCTPIQNMIAGYLQNRYYAMVVVGVPIIGLIAIQIMRYYFSKQQISRLILFMTAVGSVGCLCFVLEHPERLFIPSWLMLFPTLADGLLHYIKSLKLKQNMPSYCCLAVIFGGIVLCAVLNAAEIYLGYAENAEVYQYNDQQMISAATYGTEKVFLKRYPNVDCAGVAPYEEGVQYMKNWICNYYDIPASTEFYYSSTGEAAQYTELDNHIFIEQQ